MLRRRPTAKKAICAAVVLCAEFVCLVPTFAPGVESPGARRREGGQQDGVGRIVWPLVFFLSLVGISEQCFPTAVAFATGNSRALNVTSSKVPYALSNTTLEKISKPDGGSGDADDQDGSAVVLFWTFLFSTIFTCGLFWVDLIPAVGSVSGNGMSAMSVSGCLVLRPSPAHSFLHNNYLQVPGECQAPVRLLVVVHRFSRLHRKPHSVDRLHICHSVSVGWRQLLGRCHCMYTWSKARARDPHFPAVVARQAIRTPALLLFWTLFQESPFRWRPQASLSTWLSLVSVLIMAPAIVIYNRKYDRPMVCVTACRPYEPVAESALGCDVSEEPSPRSSRCCNESYVRVYSVTTKTMRQRPAVSK